MHPRVSVLMAVHNGARYLREAVHSILGQSWRDFEFIVVDDGSTDETPAILAACGREDGRLRLHTQPHQGLAAALNTGLELARGEYVARMDADDVSLPGRLAAQAACLEARPDVGVCGTWAATLGGRPGALWRFPVDDATLRGQLLFENPFAHPTVMLRRRVFEQAGLRYAVAFRYAQDYDLWARAAAVCELANLPQVLLRYRRHAAQAGQRHLEAQQAAASRVRARQLDALRLPLSADDRAMHEAVSTLPMPFNRAALERAEAWLLRLGEANRVVGAYPEPAFTQVLGERWYRLCRAAVGRQPWVWGRFCRSRLFAASEARWRRAAALAYQLWRPQPAER